MRELTFFNIKYISFDLMKIIEMFFLSLTFDVVQ